MFVLKKKYKELEKKFDDLLDAYHYFRARYQSAQIVLETLSKNKLEDADINKMLLLCHPDKHGGKQIAHEVTQKLLAMRGE